MESARHRLRPSHRDDAPAQHGSSARLQLMRSMAGMHYSEQLQRLRPQMPLQRLEGGPAKSPGDPEHDCRIDELALQIESQFANNRATRALLDATALTDGTGQAACMEELTAGREALRRLLSESIELIESEIAALDEAIECEVAATETCADWTARRSELDEARTRHNQMLRPFLRQDMRAEIDQINGQIAQLSENLECVDADSPAGQSLAANIAALTDRKAELAAALTAEAVEYEQWDSRWGGKRYGNYSTCSSIKAAGCGPTSLAIVLNYIMLDDPEGGYAEGNRELIKPDEVADYAKDHGRICNEGTVGSTMMEDIDEQWVQYAGRALADLDEVNEELRNGNLVFFLGKNITGHNNTSDTDQTYGGHFMVLQRVNEAGTEYDVLDCGRTEKREIQTVSNTELESHARDFYAVDGGAP